MSNTSQKLTRRLDQWPLLQRCVLILYGVIRFLVPSRRSQIAFISYPDCIDNAYAIFEAIMRSPRVREFQLVWLVKDPVFAAQRLHADYPDLSPAQVMVVRKNTLRGLYWFLRSRYVFFSHHTYWFVRIGFHQKLIYLGHGMPIKLAGARYKGRSQFETHYANCSIATSDFFAEVIADSFHLPRQHVLVTGHPRNAWLSVLTPEHIAVKEGRSRLAVWLPTFRRASIGDFAFDDSADVADPICPETLAELDGKLDGANVLLVLKFHHADIKDHDSWPEYRNIRLLSDLKFLKLGFNVHKLLACSDALITDFSSILIDYLIMNKPIGVFALDREAYTRGFNPGVPERLQALCRELNSIDELAEFLRNPRWVQRDPQVLRDMHWPNLDHPSRDLLRAVGLETLCGTDARPDGGNR